MTTVYWTLFINFFFISRLPEKAKELAIKVDGQAITLAELEDFHPEEGMILANTTSVGMKPRIDDTPLPKVCFELSSFLLMFCSSLCGLMKKKSLIIKLRQVTFAL